MASIAANTALTQADSLALAAAEYALEMHEPPQIVYQALRRLLRSQPNLTSHPVASGLLAREIDIMRAQVSAEEAKAPERVLTRLLAGLAHALRISESPTPT